MDKQRQPFTYYFNNPNSKPQFTIFEKTNALNIYVCSDDDDFSRLNLYHSSFSKKHTLKNFGVTYEGFVINTLNGSEEDSFMNSFTFLDNGIVLSKITTSQIPSMHSPSHLRTTFYSQYQNLRQELPIIMEELFSSVGSPLDVLATRINDFLSIRKNSPIQSYVKYPTPSKDKRNLISKVFDSEKVE